jgi:CHAT domain-containing protein/tetratricopeptide (TPR) repeat protein
MGERPPSRLALAAVLLLAACGAPDRPWPAAALRSNGPPVEAALGPGEEHRYRLPLEKGSLLRLVVDQQGIDAEVELDDPGGGLVLEADRLINDRGPELVLAVAERQGDYRLVIRGFEGSGPGRYAARIEVLREASAADRRSAAAYRLFTGAVGLGPEEALARRTRALATWRELGEVGLEAEALDSLAELARKRGDMSRAAELYRQAAAGFARAGDLRWEAMARANASSALLTLASPDATEQAVAESRTAALLAHRAGDSLTEAKAQHALAQSFDNQGELQQALDHYQKALAFWPASNRNTRPFTLHNLGVLYARTLHDVPAGSELLRRARDAWQPGDAVHRAATLNQLGRLAYEEGRLTEARQEGEAALALRGGDRCGRANTLAQLALVEEAQGARPAAGARLAEALRIVREGPCPRSGTRVLLVAASLSEKRGDTGTALARYRRCRELFAGQGDRIGLAESLEGIARGERARGDLTAALAASRSALDIFEGVRPTILREDLRTAFFSSAQDQWDLHVGLLLDRGDAPGAWEAAEQARARALRDLLAEAGAGLRRDAAPALAAERVLQRRLNVLETRWLGVSEADVETLRTLRRDIDALVGALEALRGELRRNNPRRASLVRPGPVSLAAVRREILDPDTVLLEYRLGTEASTVWAVTGDTLSAVRLPPRQTIEPLARKATRWMQSLDWPGINPPELCELSRMLLAPVAEHLGHRRLVVVADGALESLSFAALPDPAVACPAAPPLVDAHEIAYLPSAATLLTQRRQLAGRPPAPGWLAVVADPAYRSARLQLPGSAEEAAALVAGLPPGKIFVATGALASRQTVTGGALRGFRILHLAAHGVLDPEQPLLSALALAEVDAAGRPVEGTLPAHEIYDLDLPAELVVLSACETALGREIPGEGLVSGLPRAFLYAGAARVLVSLWPVEDQSTRDLMVLFYRGLLGRGLAPAAALQEAQRSLARKGRRPSQWAGFVLLGDWRPLPPFSG